MDKLPLAVSLLYLFYATSLKFQSKAKCKAIDMKNMTLYSYANKTHFHQKGFVQSLVVVSEIFLELGNGLLTSYFC